MRDKRPQKAELEEAAEPMVVMGRITGPFGVSGGIKVYPYTEHLDGLARYRAWWLDADDGKWQKVTVSGCEVHGSLLIALLEQYADRTAAIRLKGLQVAIPRSQLPALSGSGKDGYYWTDLIGLEVINLQGEELGKITGLLETGANDVLQVQGLAEDKKERLIPFIGSVVIRVDLQGRRVTVDWGVDWA
ncbi:MAG TPA: ribosome maturation factor RimM [Nitrosospira sp.]|nr:ribosome maturation factor RimM [Nitrosospira sp.]